jgi:Fic family protein
LLLWLKVTDIHPLIAGAVFHYEFEFIHPFADGNGRMGRLWQTLILSQWRAELAWLPVETLMHYQQERYYQVLGMCDSQSDSTPFIEFMLENMVIALKDGMGQTASLSEEMSEKCRKKKWKCWLPLRNGSSSFCPKNPRVPRKTWLRKWMFLPEPLSGI